MCLLTLSIGIRSSRYYVNPLTGHKINLIITTYEPVVAILRFHSTLVMAYVSGDAIVCAYPCMIRECVGLINSDRLVQRPRVARPLQKYRDRGFTLLHTASEWIPTHICGVHRYCGLTERSLADSATMRINMFSVLGRPLESIDARVRWRLAVSRVCSTTSESNDPLQGWVMCGNGLILCEYLHIYGDVDVLIV